MSQTAVKPEGHEVECDSTLSLCLDHACVYVCMCMSCVCKLSLSLLMCVCVCVCVVFVCVCVCVCVCVHRILRTTQWEFPTEAVSPGGI